MTKILTSQVTVLEGRGDVDVFTLFDGCDRGKHTAETFRRRQDKHYGCIISSAVALVMRRDKKDSWCSVVIMV